MTAVLCCLSQEQRHAERELSRLKEALEEAERRAEDLEHDQQHTLQKLHAAKEVSVRAATHIPVVTAGQLTNVAPHQSSHSL